MIAEAQLAREIMRKPLELRRRPKHTDGVTERIETPRGPIYVTINEDEMGLCEVFVRSLDSDAEGMARLGTLLMRSGVDPREIIAELWQVESREMVLDRSQSGVIVQVCTVAQGIALAIGRYLYGNSFDPARANLNVCTLPNPLSYRIGSGNGNGLGEGKEEE